MRKPQTLESLREQHDAAHGDHHVRAALRLRARKVARRDGLALPDWAARSEGRTAAQIAARPGGGGPRAAPARAQAARAVDTAIHPELSAWARKHKAIIQIGQSGCVLYPFLAPARTFRSAAAAVAELCA